MRTSNDRFFALFFMSSIGFAACHRTTNEAFNVATYPPQAPTRPKPILIESTPLEPHMPTAPVASKRPHIITSPHGNRNDDYYWLRDDTRKNPEVIRYLNQENTYRDAMLAPVADLQQEIFKELVGRIKKDDSTPPYRERGYWYYSRYSGKQEYPVFARKKGSLEAPEEVVLDQNERAHGHSYYHATGKQVSPNGKLLAVAEDTVGRRQYVIRFRDLTSGTFLQDELPNSDGSIAWAADSQTLFYIEQDPVTLLGIRLKRHILGGDPAEDEVVYEEKDHSYYMGIGKTSDHAYLLLHLSSTVSDEVRYLSSNRPTGQFKVMVPRERDFEYHADHINNGWIIRTNWQARNFCLMEASDATVNRREKWSQIVGSNSQVYISGFDVFDDHLVVEERSRGLSRIRIRDWKGGAKTDRIIDTDEEVYTIGYGINRETNSDWFRYQYASLKTPWTVYELNMKTGERKILKRDEVLGGFNRNNYETKREWATARDGTKIPISLLYRKEFKANASAPLLQYGYGSYGLSMDPSFVSTAISMVDRGFVYAIAHIRGGQEMGRPWYDEGKLLNKQNTFNDFIDVTEHLIAQKYVDPHKIAARGGSAGGLLMGAIANQRPDLYSAILANVPFVDVVTTMLDESIPLTTNEFDEWGNPKIKAFYDYMLSYSPYDNIEARDYPAMLVTTGFWDSQVQYYEPAKWVAKLRAMKTDNHPLILSTNMEAGHGGSSGRFRSYEETAREYVFVLQQLGMVESAPTNSKPK